MTACDGSELRPMRVRLGVCSSGLAGGGEDGFDCFGDAVVAVGTADAPVAGAGQGFEVFGGIVHEDGGAGDFEHGDVVPVVADGENLRCADVFSGGEGEDGRSLATAQDIDAAQI